MVATREAGIGEPALHRADTLRPFEVAQAQAAVDAGLGRRKPDALAADFPALKGSPEFDALAGSLAPKGPSPSRRR